MRKLLIGGTAGLLILALVLTQSVYVEWNELMLIILGTAILAALFNFTEDKQNRSMALSLRAAAGFAFGWLFCTADLFIDHLIYFQPGGNEDAAFLTLAFKLNMFSDSLFQISIISMAAVFVLSYIINKIASTALFSSFRKIMENGK